MFKDKFEIGDLIVLEKLTVELYDDPNCQGYETAKKLVGKIGKIIEYIVTRLYDDYPYRVKFDECPDSRVYNEREIRKTTQDESDKYYLLKYRDA